MKKTLSILFSILSLSIMAQVPQGVGYQGVATDANGIELVNQAISIRASVLSGSATGTIEWEETHATSTDTFGLFTLTIGQGTNTTNGAQASFADISWGTNTHYLKIEMDVTGGSTYSNMGTNQMMSVPYALYAESANINYDSISNLLSNDSTFITNVGGGMGGGGCDFKFPEGLDGDFISIDMLQGNYTVPTGKNLYILNTFCDVASTIIDVDGKNYIRYNDAFFNTNNGNGMVGSGSTLSVSYSNSPVNNMIYGFLVDKIVDFISIDMLQGNYTVPTGKNLYILNTFCDVATTIIDVDGKNYIRYNDAFFNTNNGNGMVGSGSTLSVYYSNSPANNMIYGYLADENYFAGCGGGGGSSSSSATTNNQINNYNNILNQSVTSGIFNYLYASYPTDLSFNYTVPAGKIMKITDRHFTNVSSSNPTYINGQLWTLGADIPTLLSEGTQVEIQFDYAGDGVSIQFDLIDNTQGIILNYLYASYPANSSFNYTVPAGKIMKITDRHFTNVSSSNSTYINGQLWTLGADIPTLLSEGTQVEIQFDYAGDGVSIQYILFDN